MLAKATLLAALFVGFTSAQTPEVVAEGFNGPMGVLVAPGGDVWVVDSGMGGDRELETVSPEGEPITARVGDTARIVRVSPDGLQTEVATMPSILMGQEATGGARLALVEGAVYVTNGVWSEAAGPEAMPLTAVVARLRHGALTTVADLWAFENAENPDGFVREAHPYGLTAGPDGMLYVADAGANTLLRVDPRGGEVTLLATFGGLPGPMPNPGRGGANESDPVPTGVVVGEDGTLYVSLLPGFPFIPGSAKVVAVSGDGSVSDYAGGLTMITDLRAGPDGALYAVSLGEFGEQGPTPNTGALVRIENGETETVLDGLSFPTSVAFAADGAAYLTLNGIGAPGSGQLVRVAGIGRQARR